MIINSNVVFRDNIFEHNSLFTCRFFQKGKISALDNLPHSPDLDPLIFLLITKLKMKLKVCYFIKFFRLFKLLRQAIWWQFRKVNWNRHFESPLNCWTKYIETIRNHSDKIIIIIIIILIISCFYFKVSTKS